ncbi:class II aldolase/adducin family protein [Brevibacillus laterosporus]|uniref:class II aldolase/adducin family protein n=1 Tax=Brevibacillus laterosporus TaxID=1465 RepID=UPI002E1C52A2|nr:class II aldolase/adducin family protein [Brevibacillus laterosporus]
MNEPTNEQMQKEAKIKQDICEIGRKVYEKGFGAANDGNISVRLSTNEIWITPTGVSKGALQPEMLVKVNGQGEVLEGELRPTSEMKMHLKVYEMRPDIGGIVHVHPPYATAFAIAGLPLDFATLPESVVLLGTIPVAKYATPSTQALPESIASHVMNHQGVLLENHGALTWGKDLQTAYYLMESLEFTAKINWIARQMNGARELSVERVQELVALREKMGFMGETPAGVICPPGIDVCSASQQSTSIKESQPLTVKIDEQQMEQIVNRVTEAVISRLQLPKIK